MAIKFFKRLFAADFQEIDVNLTIEDIFSKIAVRELAYQICVQRIAKAVAKCEFRTYKQGKEAKSDLYYTLNVKPNPQQSAAEFWQEFIQKLYYEKEVLVVPVGEYFFIADGYSLNDQPVTKAWTFTDVTIKDLRLNKKFTTETAFFFRLKDGNVQALLDSTTRMYSGLITAATQSYRKSNGSKLKLKISRTAENADDFEQKLNDALQKDIKVFATSDNAVYPEYDGYDLSQFGSGGSPMTSRDITALLNDVLDVTCKAFLMPLNIAGGQASDTSTAFSDFLTFCIEPIVEQIAQGFNRVYFSKDEYLAGDHIAISTQHVEHVGILDVSDSIDKLIGCGVQSVNDILRILQEEPISEKWADQHFITKNYGVMSDVLNEAGSTDK